jgi:hypothetical protein
LRSDEPESDQPTEYSKKDLSLDKEGSLYKKQNRTTKWSKYYFHFIPENLQLDYFKSKEAGVHSITVTCTMSSPFLSFCRLLGLLQRKETAWNNLGYLALRSACAI